MNDALLDFLLSRDPAQVERERVKVDIATLRREATDDDRRMIDHMPVGVLRRKIVEAERLLSAMPSPAVRVVANSELLDALRKSQAERERLARKVAELRGILERRERGAA